jgi:hypothetical protein
VLLSLLPKTLNYTAWGDFKRLRTCPRSFLGPLRMP